jgi:hypothetical protein
VLLSCTKEEETFLYEFRRDFYITVDEHGGSRLVIFTCSRIKDGALVKEIKRVDPRVLTVTGKNGENFYWIAEIGVVGYKIQSCKEVFEMKEGFYNLKIN